MEVLKDFKIKAVFNVAWKDMDAMNHVNNAVYLTYFENARIAYYDAIGLGHRMNDKAFLGIVKSINCEYLLPISYPDELEVGAKVTELTVFGFTLEHYIFSKTKGICACGETEVTVVDVLSLKPTKMPSNMIDKIKVLDNL